MDLDESTIADLFKAAGYRTGAFGKWHNGMQYPYHPNGRGFDEFYGFCSGHWGNYFDPMLERNGRDLEGRFSGEPPPPFWPDGDGTQVLHDAHGRPSNLEGRTVGSVVKVILDREAGILAYSINGGPALTALSGFPSGAALRPWARAERRGSSIAFQCSKLMRFFLPSLIRRIRRSARGLPLAM